MGPWCGLEKWVLILHLVRWTIWLLAIIIKIFMTCNGFTFRLRIIFWKTKAINYVHWCVFPLACRKIPGEPTNFRPLFLLSRTAAHKFRTPETFSRFCWLGRWHGSQYVVKSKFIRPWGNQGRYDRPPNNPLISAGPPSFLCATQRIMDGNRRIGSAFTLFRFQFYSILIIQF